MNLYIKNSKYFILNTFYTRNSKKKMTDWTDWLTMTQTQTDSVYRLGKTCANHECFFKTLSVDMFVSVW